MKLEAGVAKENAPDLLPSSNNSPLLEIKNADGECCSFQFCTIMDSQNSISRLERVDRQCFHVLTMEHNFVNFHEHIVTKGKEANFNEKSFFS